jgi:hypothetical protein
VHLYQNPRFGSSISRIGHATQVRGAWLAS